jgi:hypothetical protein
VEQANLLPDHFLVEEHLPLVIYLELDNHLLVVCLEVEALNHQLLDLFLVVEGLNLPLVIYLEVGEEPKHLLVIYLEVEVELHNHLLVIYLEETNLKVNQLNQLQECLVKQTLVVQIHLQEDSAQILEALLLHLLDFLVVKAIQVDL